jgi:cell division inhibitor SepF
MANAVRKMAEYLGLFEGNGYQDEYAENDAQYNHYQESPVAPVAPMSAPVSASVFEQQVRPSVAPVGDLSRITTIHPRTYNDARRIGEEFRDGTPVILNLTDMDDADARRVVDFAAGLAFGLRGTIGKITKDVFLLSPANVDCGAAARAQLRQDPFFNQS